MASTAELEAEILADLEENPDAYTAPVNDVITIDPETKTINLPSSEVLFGTEEEQGVERKYFKCPRIVGDNIDLSTHQIYISYMAVKDKNATFIPNSIPQSYWCDDVALDETGNYITFSWLLSGNVLASRGFVGFAVIAKSVEGDILKTRWKTAPAVGTVLMTLPDAGEGIAELYPDIITQLLDRMDAVEEIATVEAMQGYVEKYLGEHPVQLDSTLTDPEKAAPADVVGELRSDLVNATDPLIDVNTTVIPTMISGLNFPTNANAYSSDSSYNTFYVPVRNGYAYLWSITEKGSVDAYVRFAYSQNFPANGVSGTFLREIAISKSETATFYYTAPADGYLAFAVWNGDVDANDCNIAVTRQGLKTTVDGIEAVSMTPAKIENLNFADGDTAYVSSSEYEYDTFYIPVASGKSYTWVLTKASGTDPYCRFAFATSIPANGVSATQIHDEIHVFTTNTFVYTATSDGYISMSVYIDNMPIENQTVTCNKQNGLVDRVTDLEAIVSNDRANLTNKRLLYYAKESLAQDSTQVKLGDLVVVPYNAVELSIVCPDDICVYFTLIKSAYDNTSTTTGYYGNGDTVKLTADYDLYRIHFAYCTKSGDTYTLTGETLALDTVINLIVTNMLRIEYDGESVIINNKDIEKKLWSAIRNSDFVISHISDTHGDAIRYDSFLEMSKYIDVDVAINSGDAVNQNLSDGCKYIEHGIAEYPDLSTIFCFGNHDAYDTNALNASAYVSPFDTAYEYDVATDGTYYYKDYTDKSIRIIVLNIYEERRSQLFSCRISQDQIEWFIDTLESTPSGYGVIVVTHSMENYIGKVTGYDAFYEDGVTDDWCCRFSGITGYPVRDIIDAFIAKTSITGSYTQTVLTAVGESTTETETVTYSADFTSVHAEFIASINGHQHCDMIGYINGSAQTQLNLNITHGVAAHYYADQGDITRADGKGSVQDAFNIYAIDRTAKTVNVIRIGSNVTDDMSIREYMSIPYTK